MRWIVIAGTLLLAGCAAGDLEVRQTEPQLHTENECLIAANSSRCRIENALAGGAPMNFAQE
jgi:uncharacterized lipoprotein YmbA